MSTFCYNVLTFEMKMNIGAMQNIHIYNGDLFNDLDFIKC